MPAAYVVVFLHEGKLQPEEKNNSSLLNVSMPCLQRETEGQEAGFCIPWNPKNTIYRKAKLAMHLKLFIFKVSATWLKILPWVKK